MGKGEKRKFVCKSWCTILTVDVKAVKLKSVPCGDYFFVGNFEPEIEDFEYNINTKNNKETSKSKLQYNITDRWAFTCPKL